MTDRDQPGWAGPVVRIRSLSDEADPRDVAIARLDPLTGAVNCDHATLFQEWTDKGILGRSARGRVYPRDGQKFLDELPFKYRSTYFWAEPGS